MHDVMSFFAQHIELTLLFVALLVTYIILELRDGVLSSSQLSPQQVVDLMNHQSAIVIDCRDVTEFQQGHITKAVNLPYVQILENTKGFSQYKNKTIILVVAANGQYSKVKERMAKDEVKVVGLLAGGMNAWRQAQLPMMTN